MACRLCVNLGLARDHVVGVARSPPKELQVDEQVVASWDKHQGTYYEVQRRV
jgi:hypothetical protein